MPQIISIIVPVYNLETYIQHTLDSLFAQTHKALEVIAVNDGSTDNTPHILDDYAAHESRLRVIHQANAGVSTARNAGLAVATGSFIGFCDGDDEVEPTMYERLLANLLKYDADISHCSMLTKGLDGKIRYFHNTGALEIHSREEGLLEILKGEMVEPSLCMKLYKKELFQDFQFDPAIRINEDLLANVQLFQKSHKSVYEDVCLYHYLRRKNSASKGSISEKHILHPIVVRERILNLCCDESESVKRQAEICFLLTNISIFTLLQTKSKTLFNAYSSRFRSNLIQRQQHLVLLSRSSRIHAWLIIYCPVLSKYIFSVYYFLREKQYG